MLLETNRRSSSSKRTCHIDVRYFLIVDKVEKGKIKLEHCKAEDMLRDFFTKSLQGNMFIRYQNAIMNIRNLCADKFSS
jgi:hypothetical protein